LLRHFAAVRDVRFARAAELLGVSVRELREIEGGQRYPSFHTHDRIEKLLVAYSSVEGR
jgi:hypothetical protein